MGKRDSDVNADILGGGESNLKVCISFFFSLSTSEDKYVIFIHFFLSCVQRTERCRVLCASSARQDKNPLPDYLCKVQEHIPELMCLEGRSRMAQESTYEEKTCRVCTQCTSDTENSFLLLQRVTESSQVKTFPPLLWTNR